MILVTGATGLVGSHLTFELIRSGRTVRALRRRSSDLEMLNKVFHLYSDQPEELLSKIEWTEGDILDVFSLEDAMEGVEEVFHCAALVSFLPEDKKILTADKYPGHGQCSQCSAGKESKEAMPCFIYRSIGAA